ncbi:hypothetical protein ACQPYK_34660 [Streptosporangium sp. CA-135522]|uniref:hypothetical protein n=1 Tax=Streptosporangium sp. CA-135522 TaxID=3240072 RepID=UPI003D907098
MPVIHPLRADDPGYLGASRLLGRIGAGGQGVVHLAESPSGERAAASGAVQGESLEPSKGKDRVLDCSLTPGADGGPVIVDYDSANRSGYVTGVISGFEGSGRSPRVRSPYFNDEILEVYHRVSDARTEVL